MILVAGQRLNISTTHKSTAFVVCIVCRLLRAHKFRIAPCVEIKLYPDAPPKKTINQSMSQKVHKVKIQVITSNGCRINTQIVDKKRAK